MAAPVIESMMMSQSQSASGMACHLLGKERFYEVDPVSAPGDFHLDKLSKELTTSLAEAEKETYCQQNDLSLWMSSTP